MNSQVKKCVENLKSLEGSELQELFVGLHHSRTRWICLWTWKFFTLCYLDFYGSCQCRYWLSLQAFPLRGRLMVRLRVTVPNHGLVFLITTSIRNLPGVTSFGKSFQSSRKFWVWEFDVRCSYPQEITKSMGALCQKLGPKD